MEQVKDLIRGFDNVSKLITQLEGVLGKEKLTESLKPREKTLVEDDFFPDELPAFNFKNDELISEDFESILGIKKPIQESKKQVCYSQMKKDALALIESLKTSKIEEKEAEQILTFMTESLDKAVEKVILESKPLKEDEDPMWSIYTDKDVSHEVIDIISKDLDAMAPEVGEYEISSFDGGVNLHGVHSPSGFKHVKGALDHVVDTLKASGYKVKEVSPEMEAVQSEAKKPEVNEDEVMKYLEQWRDSESFRDFNLMMDRGLLVMACDLMAGSGAIDPSQHPKGSHEAQMEQGILDLAKQYKDKVKADEDAEFFHDMEVWVDPKTNEHAFIPQGDVDYFVGQNDLKNWGYEFNSGYDAEGNEFTDKSRLDEATKLQGEATEPVVDEASLRGESPMVVQYLVTAMWASTDSDEQPLDTKYDPSSISEESVEKARKDCDEFYDKAKVELEKAGKDVSKLDLEDLGHDFWLTRNHHGANFKDGDYEKDVGEILYKVANEFGESHAMVGDDGQIVIEASVTPQPVKGKDMTPEKKAEMGKSLAGKFVRSGDTDSAKKIMKAHESRLAEAKKKTKKPSRSQMSKEEIAEKMGALAVKTGLTHDGGDDDRLFVQDSNINVFANDMSEKEYQDMEKDLNKKVIKGNGYQVYAWNDSSSYKYWKEAGENGEANYIQVTAAIDLGKIDQVDAAKLKKDVDELDAYFAKYDNIDQHDFSKIHGESKENPEAIDEANQEINKLDPAHKKAVMMAIGEIKKAGYPKIADAVKAGKWTLQKAGDWAEDKNFHGLAAIFRQPEADHDVIAHGETRHNAIDLETGEEYPGERDAALAVKYDAANGSGSAEGRKWDEEKFATDTWGRDIKNRKLRSLVYLDHHGKQDSKTFKEIVKHIEAHKADYEKHLKDVLDNIQHSIDDKEGNEKFTPEEIADMTKYQKGYMDKIKETAAKYGLTASQESVQETGTRNESVSADTKKALTEAKSALLAQVKQLEADLHKAMHEQGVQTPSGNDVPFKIFDYSEAEDRKEKGGKVFHYPEMIGFNVESWETMKFDMTGDGKIIREGTPLNGAGIPREELIKQVIQNVKEWNEHVGNLKTERQAKKEAKKQESVSEAGGKPDVMVYDNGGKTTDRYTVVVRGEDGWDIYTMSGGQGPQGVNMYSHTAKEKYVPDADEKQVPVESLPDDVQKAIKDRMTNESKKNVTEANSEPYHGGKLSIEFDKVSKDWMVGEDGDFVSPLAVFNSKEGAEGFVKDLLQKKEGKVTEAKSGPEETLFTPGDFTSFGSMDSIMREKMTYANLRHLGIDLKSPEGKKYIELIHQLFDDNTKASAEEKLWNINDKRQESMLGMGEPVPGEQRSTDMIQAGVKKKRKEAEAVGQGYPSAGQQRSGTNQEGGIQVGEEAETGDTHYTVWFKGNTPSGRGNVIVKADSEDQAIELGNAKISRKHPGHAWRFWKIEKMAQESGMGSSGPNPGEERGMMGSVIPQNVNSDVLPGGDSGEQMRMAKMISSDVKDRRKKYKPSMKKEESLSIEHDGKQYGLTESLDEAEGVHPRLYVGTYKKYNEGSIDGQWMNLDDYKDKDAFLKAANDLHKDEEDPELMFQDYEGFPEQFYNESSVPDELWDWIALSEDQKEMLAAYLEVNPDGDIKDAEEKFLGKGKNEEDVAYDLIDGSGGIDEMKPEQLAHFLIISETDIRVIAGDEADSAVENMDEADILEKAEMKDQYDAESDEKKKEQILNQAREESISKVYDETKKQLEDDPIQYFEDLGYEPSAMLKFMSFDYEKYAKELQTAGDVDFVTKDGETWGFWSH